MPWNYNADDKLPVFAVIVVIRALGENLLCIISFSHMEFGLFTLHVHGEGVTEYRLVLFHCCFLRQESGFSNQLQHPSGVRDSAR